MSYNPTTDFLTLSRLAASSVAFAEMPGLDFTVAALARAGLISLSVGQTAPTANQPATAWFKPALPSWTAEGMLFLWNAAIGAYAPATPVLWVAMLSGSTGYSFQSVAAGVAAVNVGTTLLAVQRTAPVATALVLPSLVAQWATSRKLQLVDFSTSVVSHVITLTTPDSATIMQKASWQLLSTADQLAGVMLQPSPDLNSWIIAP
jgi:hypothetical protein